MAKTDFTYSCGHRGSAAGRNRADADRKARYFADQDCWECQNAAQAKAAAEAAQAQALPALTGTTKQIAWAEQLRQAALTEMERTRGEITAGMVGKCSDDAAREVSDALDLLETELRQIIESRRWIDCRDEHLGTDRWAAKQMETRHLCPTLEAEVEARRTARQSGK